MASTAISFSSISKDESMEQDKVGKEIQQLRDGEASAGRDGPVRRDGRRHWCSLALACRVAVALLALTGLALATAHVRILLLLVSDGAGAHHNSYLEAVVTRPHLGCAQRVFNFLGNTTSTSALKNTLPTSSKSSVPESEFISPQETFGSGGSGDLVEPRNAVSGSVEPAANRSSRSPATGAEIDGTEVTVVVRQIQIASADREIFSRSLRDTWWTPHAVHWVLLCERVMHARVCVALSCFGMKTR